VRVELTTYRLRGGCSATELHRQDTARPWAAALHTIPKRWPVLKRLGRRGLPLASFLRWHDARRPSWVSPEEGIRQESTDDACTAVPSSALAEVLAPRLTAILSLRTPIHTRPPRGRAATPAQPVSRSTGPARSSAAGDVQSTHTASGIRHLPVPGPCCSDYTPTTHRRALHALPSALRSGLGDRTWTSC
jgi:hypothetical protein